MYAAPSITNELLSCSFYINNNCVGCHGIGGLSKNCGVRAGRDSAMTWSRRNLPESGGLSLEDTLTARRLDGEDIAGESPRVGDTKAVETLDLRNTKRNRSIDSNRDAMPLLSIQL